MMRMNIRRSTDATRHSGESRNLERQTPGPVARDPGFRRGDERELRGDERELRGDGRKCWSGEKKRWIDGNAFRHRVRAFLLACMALLAFALPARAVEVHEVKTPKGITVWFVEDHTVPIVAMNYAFYGGAAHDPADKLGLANFLSAMLDEGAGDMPSAAFQERMEELAMSMSHSAGKEWFAGSFRALKKHAAESFRLLALAVNAPRFDEQPIERMRRQLIAAIRSKSQDPDHLAWRAFRKMLFGDHPYARDAEGTEEGIKAVTRADLQGLHKRLFAREQLLVTVAGAISEKEMVRFVDEVFGALPEKSGMAPIPAPEMPAKGRQQVITRPMPQTIVLMGHEGLLRSDPDFIPAYVVNHILGGGGFGSRLTEVVREKNGLAYSVYSAMFSYRNAGVFFAQASTRNEQAVRALELMVREIKRMKEKGVTAKELEEAKKYLIGSWPLRFDSTTKIASILLGFRQQGLGVDYLAKRNDLMRAVTLEQANRAAKRLLKPEALQIVLYGSPKLPASATKPAGATAGAAAAPQEEKVKEPALAR